MTFLANANVVSELTKSAPNPKVIEWIRLNKSETVTCTIVVGELQQGIAFLPEGRRRRLLQEWLDRYRQNLVSLPWDDRIALVWAEMTAEMRTAGKSASVKDSMIAAAARCFDLTVATRNIDDFIHTGVRIVNPFDN